MAILQEKNTSIPLDSVTQLPTRCRQASRVDHQQRKPTVDRGWMIEATIPLQLTLENKYSIYLLQ